MEQNKWMPDRLFCVLPLLALVLIGNPVASAQDLVVAPIPNVVATSNAIPEEGAGPENTVNRSGLNVNGEHSMKSSDMWLAQPGAEPVYIEFQFDAVYELREMRVWNYNVMFEAMLGFGIKDATITYSEDGADWTVLDAVQFAQGSSTADYAANTIVPLDGVSARYVRINAQSGWGVLGFVGLSEVQFLTLREATYRIRNVRATSNLTSDEEVGPENTVNGSGMNTNDRHSTEVTGMWLAAEQGRSLAYIQYEFDGAYELQEMQVWNCNMPGERILGLGLKDVSIEYSEDGADWTILDSVQFAQAPGKADYAANTIVPMGGVLAQYVRITVQSSWGSLDVIGLGEVRFFTNQAPSSPTESYTLALDDFEAYNDDDLRIYLLWSDGFGVTKNGSRVGHLAAPFAETTIVNSGYQSMPLFYDNMHVVQFSEASRNLEAELQDWRVGGAEALTLYFSGSVDNGADRLYVAVEDDRGLIAVVYHSAPEALMIDDWQEWTIGLDEFDGVDLSHVQRLILGVGDRSGLQSGGEGIVYIDDIGLIAGPTQPIGR